MKIFESLQSRLAETGSLHRVTVVDPKRDASRVAVVFIQVPPLHRFPQHIHSHSEDCFFVLSGGGEVFDPNRVSPVFAVSGVWVPPGVPHGLVAGPSGVIEIGFQSPPGPTVESAELTTASSCCLGITTASVPIEAELGHKIPEWRPVFAERPEWRYLDPQYCCLGRSQQIQAIADGHEIYVVVISGKVELQGQSQCLGAVSAVHLDVGESRVLRAMEENTLILGVRVSIT